MAEAFYGPLPEHLRPYALHDPAPGALDEASRAIVSAASKDDLPSLLALLAGGVSPDACRIKGNQRALHAALTQHHWEIATALLENGADPNSINGRGRTALHVAAAEHTPLPLIQLLLAKGADPLRRNRKSGLTPRDEAYYRNKRARQSLLALLIKAENEAIARHGSAEAAARHQLNKQASVVDQPGSKEGEAGEREEREVDASRAQEKEGGEGEEMEDGEEIAAKGEGEAEVYMCRRCHLPLRKRRRVEYMLERYPRQPYNGYVEAFVNSGMPQRLMEDERLHKLADKHNLRKEVTETWAVLEGVKRAQQMLPEAVPLAAAATSAGGAVAAALASAPLVPHGIVDLCAGSSLTSAAYNFFYPTAPVLAVDRLKPFTVPHFEMPVAYMEADIMLDGFFERLTKRLGQLMGEVAASLAAKGEGGLSAAAQLSTQGEEEALSSEVATLRLAQGGAGDAAADSGNALAPSTLELLVPPPSSFTLVGMHLCGTLSLRAIKAFEKMPEFGGIVLSPCCFPGRKAGCDVVRDAGLKNELDMYAFWAKYLQERLQPLCDHVELLQDTDILSNRNIVVIGVRRGGAAA
jgi:hypothetical protein